MRLDSSQRAQVRRALRGDADPFELGGELNVVPFLDIVTNIIMFLLATTFVAMAVAQLPVALAGHGPGPRHGLELSVTLVRGGAIVATRDGKLGTDCQHYASGRVLTTTDWRALDACLAHVKAQEPGETDIVLSADPDVPYSDFVRAMDVARGTDGDRFPHVLLSAGVR